MSFLRLLFGNQDSNVGFGLVLSKCPTYQSFFFALRSKFIRRPIEQLWMGDMSFTLPYYQYSLLLCQTSILLLCQTSSANWCMLQVLPEPWILCLIVHWRDVYSNILLCAVNKTGVAAPSKQGILRSMSQCPQPNTAGLHNIKLAKLN